MLRIFTNFREILRVKVGYLQSWGQKMQNILQKAHATALLAVFFFFWQKYLQNTSPTALFYVEGLKKNLQNPRRL